MWIDNKDHRQKLGENGTFEQGLLKLKMQMLSFVLYHYITENQLASYIEHKLQSGSS